MPLKKHQRNHRLTRLLTRLLTPIEEYIRIIKNIKNEKEKIYTPAERTRPRLFLH